MSEISETPKGFMNGYLSSENGPLNVHSNNCNLPWGGGAERGQKHDYNGTLLFQYS